MSRLAEAQAYVGTDYGCGLMQLRLAQQEGLLPTDNVLEIGCGCLSAGAHILNFLNGGTYVGIEPNRWLVDAGLENELTRQRVQETGSTFLDVSDFDASPLQRKFDFVLSHSVLSHCANWQVPQFIANAAKVLSDRGRILASFRMAEGNPYGSSGSDGRQDSTVTEWQYPGIAWYRQHTICACAFRCGLIALLRPEHTRTLTAVVPKDFHDWMLFCRP